MKFSIFSLSERYYKVITAVITIVITAGCFVYYYQLEDKGNTFIVATIYAAYLFIVGLYLSYMSSNISNKLYERKNDYIMLKRLNEIFSISCMTSLDSYEDISFAIISFQVFTGRTKRNINKDIKKKAIASTVSLDFMIEPQPQIDNNESSSERHYIKEIGFKFQPKLQIVEDSYISEYAKLKSSIQENVNTFIAENKIELSIHGGFFEFDLLATNYEDWCNEHVSENSAEKRETLIQHIYKTIDGKQTAFNNLDEKKIRLIEYYEKCNNRIQKNLKIMNDTYGNRLEFIIRTKEDILVELELLSDRIERMEKNINSQLSDSIHATDECCRDISDIQSNLRELQDTIVDEIQVNFVTLEEDLGIEFDTKEKFKEIERRCKRE